MVVDRWSTAAFPSWNAEPAGVWNYALAMPAGNQPVAGHEPGIQVQRGNMTEDPWVDPPVRITAPVRRVAGWTLATDPGDTSIRYSPELPALPGAAPTQESKQEEEVPARDFLPAPLGIELAKELETVSLVPYGSTHLRVTIFPDARAVGAGRQKEG